MKERRNATPMDCGDGDGDGDAKIKIEVTIEVAWVIKDWAVTQFEKPPEEKH